MRVAGQSVYMLPTQVAVHDIEDAEGFVAATIERSRLKLTTSEFEELLAEGISILFDLAERFEPQRPGYAQPGRFSGFAAQFLPRRLGDAWHRWHPEHRYVTDPDGTRSWKFYPAPGSLEALAEGPDGAGASWEANVRDASQWASPVLGAS